MKNIKRLISNCFGTPRRAILSVVCIIAALGILGAISVSAATAAAKSSAIGEEAAKNYAFADAGVDPVSAENVKAEFDFEGGQFVYDVEFTAGDTEYEYWIKSSDGTVVKKEAEIVTLDLAQNTADAAAAAASENTTASETPITTETQTSERTETTETAAVATTTTGEETAAGNTEVTLETAINIALTDAGVSAGDVTYQKTKQDTDDGVAVYEIEFYTSATEYEYEIRVSDGAILNMSTEVRKTAGTANTDTSGSANTTDSSYISVDEAKAIALNRAGLTESEVTFKKAKLDKEDKIMVYEIEFYKDRTEYECTINASTGTIIEFESDVDD